MTDSTTDPIAKPWYMSKAVIGSLAGLVMAVAPKLLLLIGINLPITQDQANEFVLFVLPQAVALYGRLTASHILTSSASAATAINVKAK